MSFGKPKNPLLEVTNERFIDYHVKRLEGRMRGEPFVFDCGCTFKLMAGLRGRLLHRCAFHEATTEFTPDPPKEDT